MGWLSKLLGADERNARLAAWGQSVPVSQAQRTVMRELWLAAKAGSPPASDPLLRLSADNRGYINMICSADYRPGEFGNADVMRTYLFKKFLGKGFTPEQAAVVVGMTVNMVGPTDL